MTKKSAIQIRKKRYNRRKWLGYIKKTVIIGCTSVALFCGVYGVFFANYPARIYQTLHTKYIKNTEKFGFICQNVQVHGDGNLEYLNAECIGKPMVLLNLEEIYQKILKDPAIQNVAIRKRYPSGLDIYIEERVPIAMWYNNKKYFQIDKEGHVFEGKAKNLPLCCGEEAPQYIGDFLELIKPSGLSKSIVIYKYIKSGRFDVVLESGLVVRLPRENPEKGIDRLKRFLEVCGDENIGILDLRVPDKIIMTKNVSK